MSHKDNLLKTNVYQKRKPNGQFVPNDILKTYMVELSDSEIETANSDNEFVCPECGEWTSNPLPCCGVSL